MKRRRNLNNYLKINKKIVTKEPGKIKESVQIISK